MATQTRTDVRCAACGRITLKPAAIVGRLVLGPTCARIAGLTASKASAALRAAQPSRRVVRSHEKQGQLFDEQVV